MKCKKCSRRHHVSICPGNDAVVDITPPSTDQQARGGTDPHRLNPEATFYQTTTATSLYVDASKAVLLQTARAIVCNPRSPGLSLEVRIILDSDSQWSYNH